MVAITEEKPAKAEPGLGCCAWWRTSLRGRRVMCYIVGCLTSIVSGSMLAFNVYSIDLKDAFKLSQSQVELLAGVVMVCANIGYPIGLLYERFGPGACYGLSGVLGFISCFMIYWATSDYQYYTQHMWWLAVFYGIYGLATLPMYVISMTVNMGNFAPKYRGRIVGSTGAFWWLGSAVFSLIFNSLFVPYSDYPFRQYFLMLAITFLIVSVIAIIFIREVPMEYEEIADGQDLSQRIANKNDEGDASNVALEMDTMRETLLSGDQKEVAPADSHEEKTGHRFKDGEGGNQLTDENLPLVNNEKTRPDEGESGAVVIEETLAQRIGLDLLLMCDFHLISWSFLCVCSVELMLVANVTIFADAYGMEYLIDTITVISPVCAAVSKLCTGFLSDCVLHTVPRTAFILGGTILQSCLLLVAIFHGDDPVVFVMMIVISYCTNGIYFAITPTILSEFFGLYHFSRNWGVELLLVSLLDLILLQIFGGLYSKNTGESGINGCIGQTCFRGIYIISFLMTSVGIPLLLILLRREKARRKKM